MSTRILTQEQVREVLPMRDCMDALRGALVTQARGQALNPLRAIHWLNDRSGALGLMPAWLGDPPGMGGKVLAVFPGNHGTEYDSHQGVVLLFETTRGLLRAILDATEVTAIRTAAASGVATEALARADATDLALVGSGTQARSHLVAMLEARPIRRVRCCGRDQAQLARFVGEIKEHFSVDAEACDTVEATVRDAHIVCTVTSATEPVVLGEWLAPGTHINAVGACMPASRELDGAAVARSRLFVDSRESAHAESGDFLLAKQDGLIGDDHILAELGDVLAGTHAGRTHDDDVTLFKSLGIGVEDVAAAQAALRNAEARDVGTVLDLGGRR